MQEIPLTKGYTAFCDDSDALIIMQYHWSAQVAITGKVYAVCYTKGGSQNRKRIYMHRLIVDASNGDEVHHIRESDTLDNRRENLLVCNNRKEHFSLHNRRGKTSQYRGVYMDKRGNKWYSCIYYRGKLRYVGYFKSAIEAARAYNAKAIELFGEQTYLNDI